MIRVFINDLVLDSTESRMIIDICDQHTVHQKEQITAGFYNTCDFTFESFSACLRELRKRMMGKDKCRFCQHMVLRRELWKWIISVGIGSLIGKIE